MKHTIESVALEGFGLELASSGNRLLLKLTGTGDAAAIPALRTCLQGIPAEMNRLKVEGIDIDVRGLYFLNSSCLKTLVTLIYDIKIGDRPYNIRFLVDARLTWQRRSLAALQRMAPELISIVGE